MGGRRDVRLRRALEAANEQEADITVQEISGAAEMDGVLESDGRGLAVEFWGTWCRPCRSLRPHLERLAAKHADRWRVVAVHVEKNVDLVVAWSVQSTPTIVYLRDGAEVHRSSGAVDADNRVPPRRGRGAPVVRCGHTVDGGARAPDLHLSGVRSDRFQ